MLLSEIKTWIAVEDGQLEAIIEAYLLHEGWRSASRARHDLTSFNLHGKSTLENAPGGESKLQRALST